MSSPSGEGGLDYKLILIVGLVVIVLLSAGAYYFLGFSVQDKVEEIIPVSGKIQNIEQAYALAEASAAQRNEGVFSEGDSRKFNNTNMTVIKISLGSAKIKVGNETSIIGSGKEHDFGSMVVSVKAITFSQDAKNRKAIIGLSKSNRTSNETPNENQSREITLGEGESAANENPEIAVISISESEVSVRVGTSTKSIRNGETLAFGDVKIKVQDIFYTRQSEESRAVLVVTESES